MSTFSAWLDDPYTWVGVANALAGHDYTYDLSDRSHRLDVVEIVLTAAAELARAKQAETVAKAARWTAEDCGMVARCVCTELEETT